MNTGAIPFQTTAAPTSAVAGAPAIPSAQFPSAPYSLGAAPQQLSFPQAFQPGVPQPTFQSYQPAFAVPQPTFQGVPQPIFQQSFQGVGVPQGYQQESRAPPVTFPYVSQSQLESFTYSQENYIRSKGIRIPTGQLPQSSATFTLYDQITNRPIKELPLLLDQREVILREKKSGRTRWWPSTQKNRDELLGDKPKPKPKPKVKKVKKEISEEDEYNLAISNSTQRPDSYLMY